MSPYRLHCFAQSGNAYKVALYLNCAGLDWEPVFVDFFAGVGRSPEYRATLNEMGEVPVLEHGGKKRTQSGAILQWLADTTGMFKPLSEDERYEVLRWILFDNHKFTGYMATYRFLRSFAPKAPAPDVMAFLKGRVDAAYAIVETHLSGSKFVVGNAPTIADFSLAGYVYYPGEETGLDLNETHPSIFAWSERLKALPGWKGPYDLMPGKRFMVQR